MVHKSVRVHIQPHTHTPGARLQAHRARSAAPPAIATSASHLSRSAVRTSHGEWRASSWPSSSRSGASASSSRERSQCSFEAAQARSRWSFGEARHAELMRHSSELTSSKTHGGCSGVGASGRTSEDTVAGSGNEPSGWGVMHVTPMSMSADWTSAGHGCLNTTSTSGRAVPQKEARALRVSRESCCSRSIHAELPNPKGSEAFASSHHLPPAPTTSMVTAGHEGGCTV
jgi:hypothetical protein